MPEVQDANSLVGILVLSDLHFNYKEHYCNDTAAYSRHKTCLDNLSKKIEKIHKEEWKIDCIAITGDVGYQGHPEDYVKAKKWLVDLTNRLGIDPRDVVICPGNHDIDQNNLFVPSYPTSKKEANDQLKVENLDEMKHPFIAFENFQRDFCKIPFRLGFDTDPEDHSQQTPFYENFLVGQKIVKRISFISLNSAWYCRDSKTDKNKLWLGLPQFYAMEAAGQLMDYENCDDHPITVALFHHPPALLHRNDGTDYLGTYEQLVDKSNFILTGHIHELRPDFIQRRSHARTLVSGCVYNNADYNNICSIIEIDLHNRHFWFKRLSWDGRKWNFPNWPDDQERIFPKIMPQPRFREMNPEVEHRFSR